MRASFNKSQWIQLYSSIKFLNNVESTVLQDIIRFQEMYTTCRYVWKSLAVPAKWYVQKYERKMIMLNNKREKRLKQEDGRYLTLSYVERACWVTKCNNM